mmetsp:Transcript_12931/g.26822  ORF Transcript_12931/g.26822 Transcript_12931/m.26822 type:complete len:307 (+) Transcript_12931:1989-2909(+)
MVWTHDVFAFPSFSSFYHWHRNHHQYQTSRSSFLRHRCLHDPRFSRRVHAPLAVVSIAPIALLRFHGWQSLQQLRNGDGVDDDSVLCNADPTHCDNGYLDLFVDGRMWTDVVVVDDRYDSVDDENDNHFGCSDDWCLGLPDNYGHHHRYNNFHHHHSLLGRLVDVQFPYVDDDPFRRLLVDVRVRDGHAVVGDGSHVDTISHPPDTKPWTVHDRADDMRRMTRTRSLPRRRIRYTTIHCCCSTVVDGEVRRGEDPDRGDGDDHMSCYCCCSQKKTIPSRKIRMTRRKKSLVEVSVVAAAVHLAMAF